MNAKELLYINGNFKNSPLIKTLQKIHNYFTGADIPYTVIGGLAVIRNGAYRTTHDIDILTKKDGWEKIKKVITDDFETGIDNAKDKENNIDIDLLFEGDDWDMVFVMPSPEKVYEYDEELKANFMDLFNILQLKTAVYMQKEKESGIEIASKDLSDVVELIKQNKDKISDIFINKLHDGVRETFKRIYNNVNEEIRKSGRK
jgi:hypothetical protein